MAKVLVLYSSSYGHIETIAYALAQGARPARARAQCANRHSSRFRRKDLSADESGRSVGNRGVCQRRSCSARSSL
jgi:hypothetical protein